MRTLSFILIFALGWSSCQLQQTSSANQSMVSYVLTINEGMYEEREDAKLTFAFNGNLLLFSISSEQKQKEEFTVIIDGANEQIFTAYPHYGVMTVGSYPSEPVKETPYAGMINVMHSEEKREILGYTTSKHLIEMADEEIDIWITGDFQTLGTELRGFLEIASRIDMEIPGPFLEIFNRVPGFPLAFQTREKYNQLSLTATRISTSVPLELFDLSQYAIVDDIFDHMLISDTDWELSPEVTGE